MHRRDAVLQKARASPPPDILVRHHSQLRSRRRRLRDIIYGLWGFHLYARELRPLFSGRWWPHNARSTSANSASLLNIFAPKAANDDDFAFRIIYRRYDVCISLLY